MPKVSGNTGFKGPTEIQTSKIRYFGFFPARIIIRQKLTRLKTMSKLAEEEEECITSEQNRIWGRGSRLLRHHANTMENEEPTGPPILPTWGYIDLWLTALKNGSSILCFFVFSWEQDLLLSRHVPINDCLVSTEVQEYSNSKNGYSLECWNLNTDQVVGFLQSTSNKTKTVQP